VGRRFLLGKIPLPPCFFCRLSTQHSANIITATASTPKTTPSAIPSVRSLGRPLDSFASAEGSGSLAVLVSVARGRFTSWLDTGTVASVVGVVVGDVLVYVDDSMTITLGQVSDATSVIVVDG
jgi:hypothetical protein